MQKFVASAALLVTLSIPVFPAFAEQSGPALTAPALAPPRGVLQRFQAWRAQRRALREVERVIHADPRLERRFEDHYARRGGRALWQAKDAWVALGIGSAINFGGYLQPELLLPYLFAGIAVDVGTFSTRLLGNSRARQKTVAAMIADHSVPMHTLAPYRQALGSLWPQPRQRAPQTAPALAH